MSFISRNNRTKHYLNNMYNQNGYTNNNYNPNHYQSQSNIYRK